MRGFVKTLEAVIAGLVMLSILPLIFMGISYSDEWAVVSMKTSAYDSLNSFLILNPNMIKGNSRDAASSIRSEMDTLLRIAAQHLEIVRGLPRPDLVIGTDSSSIKQSLSDYVATDSSFKLGGINMSYILMYDSIISPSILDSDDKYRMDAIILTGSVSPYKTGAMDYMKNGGTLVILSNSPDAWVVDELGLSSASSSSHTFSGSFDGYDLSRKFYFTPVKSYLEFRFSDLKYHGNITIRGSVYDYTYNPNDECLNYSGVCYYPGDTFSVGGETIYYQNHSSTDYTELVIKNQAYTFQKASSYRSDYCLVGSAACLVAGKRIGNGALIWMPTFSPSEISMTDNAQLLRAVLLWGVSGVNYIHPNYYTSKEIHDIRAPMVDKPFGKKNFVKASVVIPLDEWPVEMDLYVWSLY